MRRTLKLISKLIHPLLVLLGAAVLTLVFFLVLPLMQTISEPPPADTLVQSVDTVTPPPPPPPVEEEPEEEPEPEEQPPELTEQAPPLDLSQLELALNPGFGDGAMAGDFGVKLNTVINAADNADALLSMEDLEQKPRVIFQPSPVLTPAMRAAAPATVYVKLIIDQSGRVTNAKIESSTNPIFEKPTLNAVKRWRFNPGKRNGKPARARMRVPITFPKG